MGWPTGLEPATARTTIWSSTIELRPPSRIQILVFRRAIANASRSARAWHNLRFIEGDAPSFDCNLHPVCYHPRPTVHEEFRAYPSRASFLPRGPGFSRSIGRPEREFP